eukprot:g9127.t1 g9127   contig35:95781-96134(-)
MRSRKGSGINSILISRGEPGRRKKTRSSGTLQKQFGNKWKKIPAYLPGRSDNDIKNRWYSSMRSLKRRTDAGVGELSNTRSKITKVVSTTQAITKAKDARAHRGKKPEQQWEEATYK